MGTPPQAGGELLPNRRARQHLPPHRLSSADAHALLRDNFVETARAESLAGHECWDTLKKLAAQTIAAGRTYDAQILAIALKLGATALLTLNTADFVALAADEIEIRSPLL